MCCAKFQGNVLTHSLVSTSNAWDSVLADSSEAVDEYKLTKTLVFKPKTPKSKTTVPVVLIALDSSTTSLTHIAKVVKAQDLRLANSDLVASVFDGISPADVGPVSIDSKNASFLTVVLDAAIEDSPDIVLAIHPSSASQTAFMKSGDLVEYLKSTGVSIMSINFKGAYETSFTPADLMVNAPKINAKRVNTALIGITVDKNLDFSRWYQQILTKGEMLEYYDVSGCYILRPASYSIWEKIHVYFDERIKSIGVQNAYFPMFVSAKVLEKEKDHIEGFAPEVAWVTRAGKSELEEPIAIRPTSETAMYPYYAKWIRSHRDLPLKLNQWNSVVRWEFKHPQPFLRTREFLWQEGHTAHLTFEEANNEVMQILDWYEAVYHDLLAVPVIKGRKTENEKFAGGYFTTTVEGYIPTTGRGIQGATSHCLGQNFSKMFNITVENPEGPDKPKICAWQNSWGLSTRAIGVMVMVHSDNKGLVLPPRVAQFQVVVIPCGLTVKTSAEEKKSVLGGVVGIESTLKNAGIRATGDCRENYSPGWKFADWELRGVPLRLEYGPSDMKKVQVIAVRRDTGAKVVIPLDEKFPTVIEDLFETIQTDMFIKAKNSFDSHIRSVENLADFVPALSEKCVLLAPFCGGMNCEDSIKERTAHQEDGPEVDDKAPSMGAKSLCIPFDQPKLKEGTKCVGCTEPAKFHTLFGRSY